MERLIEEIQELQAQRVSVVRGVLRLDNMAGSYVRRFLGWQPDLPEKERKAINARAARLAKAVREGKQPKELGPGVVAYILRVAEAGEPLRVFRDALEKNMRQAARRLPVWPWVEATPGFGDLGLAIIVGEAGDLAGYANPAKLWKRMGVAVLNGERQRKKTDPDEAKAQGYNPRRRSALWTIGDSLLKAEGPYRELYCARKTMEKERAPEMTKMKAHRRAQRYMEKRLLRNLWRAWRAKG
ncbi:unnamed protein product [marine sediment metagenome]|uniref:Uncharacterized protein n=1 Tax=marine sediment metagenome TaxID=412755 RepID=X1G243_9ZZZZ